MSHPALLVLHLTGVALTFMGLTGILTLRVAGRASRRSGCSSISPTALDC